MPNDREQQAAAGRKGMASRWAAYRAERVAAGLPPTRREELGRSPVYIADLEVEAYWMRQAEELGIVANEEQRLGVDRLTRTQHRRVAKLLADSETARAMRAADDGRELPDAGSDEARMAFYEREVERWRERARSDRRHAERHDRYADAAERELGRLMLRRDRG